MRHFIAILQPIPNGGWRVVFPDVPGCEANGSSIDDARAAAVQQLYQYANGADAPGLRDLSDIERDTEWLSRNGIDLSKAIVTIIPLGG
jgi:hypothetical protein